jgi:Flp pilus assembly protein TadG
MFTAAMRLLQARRHEWNRGGIAVEFALGAPVVIVLALAVADYGLLMNNWASLRGATRAGAEYVKANWNNPNVTDPTTAAEQLVCSFLGLTLSGTSCSPVTPNVSTACSCSDATAVSCPAAGGANPCTALSDSRVLVSVTVSATQRFTPMISRASFAFPSTLTASAIVRTQ